MREDAGAVAEAAAVAAAAAAVDGQMGRRLVGRWSVRQMEHWPRAAAEDLEAGAGYAHTAKEGARRGRKERYQHRDSSREEDERERRERGGERGSSSLCKWSIEGECIPRQQSRKMKLWIILRRFIGVKIDGVVPAAIFDFPK